MHFAVMGLDGAEGPCAEAAVLEVTPVRGLLAVGVQVLPEVNQVLAAARRGQEGLEGGGTLGHGFSNWWPLGPLTCSHNSHT